MVVSREEVLAAIRRESEAAGGVVPGMERFEKATGIRRHEWYGVHWAGWGEALTEAGYAPNVWGGDAGRTADELAELLAEVVRERGRWPSPAQVGLAHRLDPRIPAANTLRLRLGGKADQVALVYEWAVARPDWADVAAILGPLLTSTATARPTASAPLVTGYVYLFKSGKHHKVGRSNAPERRAYEVRLQMPEKVETIHTIATDDPEGIEAYWHRRFASKRANGEWFNLAPEDVAAFRSRSYM